MPSPKQASESEREFMQRCIKYVKDEGKSTQQAIAQCLQKMRKSGRETK